MRNIDYNYVNIRKSENDYRWKQNEKNLYYSYKNDNYVIATILICVLSLFTKGSIICSLIAFCVFLYLCHIANIELDKSDNIIKMREEYKKMWLKEHKGNE